MRKDHPLKTAVERTVWVARSFEGFTAFDYRGNVVAHNKYQSTLVYILRREAKERNIHAIAAVVLPTNRIPNRKLNRSKRKSSHNFGT